MDRTTQQYPISSALIYGPPGHGKTTFIRRLSDPLSSSGSCLKILEADQLLAEIDESRYDQCLIFCDEIDELTEQQQYKLGELMKNIGRHVFFVGATNKPETLISQLKSSFNQQILILQDTFGRTSQIQSKVDEQILVEQLLKQTQQLSPADIDWLLNNSFNEHNIICINQFQNQIKIYQPSGLRGLQMQQPEEVFGHEAIIDDILLSIKNNQHNNFLLFGPPGTGKNQLIKHFANLNIKIPVSSSSEVVGPYVGQSEKALDKLFKQASLVHPSILFIDEIDGLFCDKSQQNQRLLTVFQDLIDLQLAIVIVATNKPYKLPDQIRSRFKPCYLPPLNATQAARLIKQQLHGIKELNFEYLGQLCDGCTGSVIKSALYQIKQKLMFQEINQTYQQIQIEHYFYKLEKISDTQQTIYLEYLK
ncbi:Cell division control protein 48 [Spironucleus salmonicida]|uniref:AAA family ATPase, CDC 48 subfamily n=1 Tax=Spironucleus salmonicida TaxID=348837 RepID=V6LKC4_9EUKA|nr:Cell division control protein 48 [Spironucleus salmonicida]|eukprot:EST45090.1 AAA family ATPase, CDC 48 subfamily [Spironucleus salmonicida]